MHRLCLEQAPPPCPASKGVVDAALEKIVILALYGFYLRLAVDLVEAKVSLVVDLAYFYEVD